MTQLPDGFGTVYRRELARRRAPASSWALAMWLVDCAYVHRSATVALGYRLARQETSLHGRSLERARDWLVENKMLVFESGKGREGRTSWTLCLPEECHYEVTLGDSESPIPERGELSPIGDVLAEGMTALARTFNDRATADVNDRADADIPPGLNDRAGADVNDRTNDRTNDRAGAGTNPSPKENISKKWIPDLNKYTGCRVTRGTHGAGHKYDPLGTDRPPNGWPYTRPTRDEIAAALDARERELAA